LERNGEPFYRIENYDAMEAFFMSVVSASDHYLFISSNGGLTAGRKDPDHALFPYYTDDRTHDAAEHTGSKTIFRLRREGHEELWEPFSIRSSNSLGRNSRTLYKSVYGNKIVFEEVNQVLGLAFEYEWATGETYGFVRTAKLKNLTSASQHIELLDGLQNILPDGVTRRFQLEYSTLVDGYKRAELELSSGLGIFQLTSVPVDRAEPSEALCANIAWSTGLDQPLHLLSSTQLDSFRRGEPLVEETDIHGRRCAYFVNASLNLAGHSERGWRIVADVSRDAAEIHNLLRALESKSDLSAELKADIARGTQNLLRIVASADGLQKTRNEANTWHHFSSSMFNVMRGGVPSENYWVSREDFSSFVSTINRGVASAYRGFLEMLPEKLLHRELLNLAKESGSADFERIAHEYLPLTFSRRHGDPSRPWNVFEIRVKDDQGKRILGYQGNWRDIFQNWEALSYSYPGFAVSMIFKFLNSSTADGFNPYRISRDGYEWEVLDPHDAWSFIGYWGDHQVVYLLRLLEQAKRCEPDALKHLLNRNVFTYANVPYRIKSYEQILEDPQDTIIFDRVAHKRILRNVAKLGADAKALASADGQLVHASLCEKIVLLLLARLSNFVPGAGIWMNTQRPEWNDANNALVGSGASMVTVYHLRRYLQFVQAMFAEGKVTSFVLPVELVEWFERVGEVLRRHLGEDETDTSRKAMVDELGRAASAYRDRLYTSGFSGERKCVPASVLDDFLNTALLHVDDSIRRNRRQDGLYHSYNLLERSDRGIGVHELPLMLEGQVAVLSSGALSPQDASSLLDALRRSALYRADQNSYMLYPLRTQKSFLEKNNVPRELAIRSRLLARMIEQQDRRLLISDAEGGLHFNAAFRNVGDLRQALDQVEDRALRKLARVERALICEIYEEVFHHRFFTGRSQTLYKYEGVGCIYWHMVSKLLLAVREVLEDAVRRNTEEPVLRRIREHYDAIRAGLGTQKTPSEYGAVPMDPYSHTPDFAGAQQPGMTGQVKEDFIARMGELGLSIDSGRIRFMRQCMTADESLDAPASFRYWDVNGEEQIAELDAGTLAFTYCQVPIVLHNSGPARMIVSGRNGEWHVEGNVLDPVTSEKIFQRRDEIRRLDVFLDRLDQTRSK
jgi:hypothetical protein